jgi:ribosomal protein S18 acetylase RimI-like enzyme
MHATLELARRLDRVEIDFCALTTLRGEREAATLERGGALAVYGAPGSPVNKVLGLGLGVEVTDEDLDAIEDFYAERTCPVQIELCPLAAPDLPSRLTRRGFVLQAFENQLARLAPSEPVADSQGADIKVETGSNEGVWRQVIAEGFAAPERTIAGPVPADAVAVIGDMMRQFQHPDLVRYLAWVDGEPAAGASSAVFNGVLFVFGTATRPRFRRRGLQRAIVARAMNDARGTADVLMATTEPGSVSQRNFERLGFQVMYTRAILVKS